MLTYDEALKWHNFLHKASLHVILYTFFIVVIILMIKYPENILLWKSKIQDMFSFLGTKVKKKQIENEIKANILKVSKKISSEIEDVIPYDLKINWVTESTRDSFINGNTVVVCMDNHKNKTRNIVIALNDYVNNGLLAEEKPYVDEKLMQSSCLVMTRKLLLLSYIKGYPYFFQEILNKESECDNVLKELIDKLINLDDNGMFTQIMLRELKEQGQFMLGKFNTNNFRNETKAFIEYLYNVAIRDNGDNSTKLSFKGKYYKSSIIIVANYDTYLNYGTKSYIKRFNQNVLEGFTNIYLCARNKNQTIVVKVLNELFKIYELDYKKFSFIGTSIQGDKYNGTCIAIKVKNKKEIENVV